MFLISPKKCFAQNFSLRDEIKRFIKEADVVLSTLAGTHGKGYLGKSKKKTFGLTVIDECSQVCSWIFWSYLNPLRPNVILKAKISILNKKE